MQLNAFWDKEPINLSEAATAALRYEGIHKTEQQSAAEFQTAVTPQPQPVQPQQQQNQVLPRKQVRAVWAEVESLRAELEEVRQRAPQPSPAARAVETNTCQSQLQSLQDEVAKLRRELAANKAHTAGKVDRCCYRCGMEGHLAKDCRGPQKCYHCGKAGHVKKDCYAWLRLQSNGSSQQGSGGQQRQSNGGGRQGNDEDRGSNGGAAAQKK